MGKKKVLGKTSKRQTLRKKHKIEKNVREHNRKVRKQSKGKARAKNALSNTAKLAKDPGIPKLHPLKEVLLDKIALQREKMKEEEARQKEARREQLAEKRRNQKLAGAGGGDGGGGGESDEFALLKMQADEKQRTFDQKSDLFSQANSSAGFKKATSAAIASSSVNYFREFRKLTKQADVVLCVLDARDPLACRSPDIERAIMQEDANKRIVFVLNKVDLVPKLAVEAWLKYLRHLYPTIPFKSATHDQRKHFGQSTVSVSQASEKQLRSKESVGTQNLMQLLKNYARSQNNSKKIITVGVIGFPNVGKSSLINSLKRSKAVGVGATPGFTKKTQEIYLDKNIRLLDCPGIVFPASDQANVSLASLALQNVIKIEQLEDPIEPISLILERVKKSNLLQTYNITNFSNVNEFLMLVAGKRGKLKPGGIPDLEAAARLVLRDWVSGKITYVALPPSAMPAQVLGAEIVGEWGKEFDIDSVIANAADDNDDNDIQMTEDMLVPSSMSAQVSTQYFSPQTEEDEQAELFEEDDDGDGDSIHTSVGLAFLEQTTQQTATQKRKTGRRRSRSQSSSSAETADEPFDFNTDFIADSDMMQYDAAGQDDFDDDDNGGAQDYDDDDDDLDIMG